MWSFFPLLTHLFDFALLSLPFLYWYALPSLYFTRFILSVILERLLYHFTPNYTLSCSSSLWDFLFGLVVCLDWFAVLWLWNLMILLGFDEFARVWENGGFENYDFFSWIFWVFCVFFPGKFLGLWVAGI